jgi:hypothetical protein
VLTVDEAVRARETRLSVRPDHRLPLTYSVEPIHEAGRWRRMRTGWRSGNTMDIQRLRHDRFAAWMRVLEYGERLGNLTVFKRLGYLLENLELGDEAIVEECRRRISGSVGRLDPARPAGGPTSKRWGLRLNLRIES